MNPVGERPEGPLSCAKDDQQPDLRQIGVTSHQSDIFEGEEK
jgi:hypothetical protein